MAPTGKSEPVKWYLITGCDTGFGKASVEKMAKAGLNVFAGVYSEGSFKEFEGMQTVVPLLLDVTKDESVEAVVKQVEEKLAATGGVLSGIVNNAGLMLGVGPVEWMPLSYLQKMLAVNVEGLVRVTRAFIPLLRPTQGRIVNTASVVGTVPIPLQTYYSATKFAVQGFSAALRSEIGGLFGITVHVIEPGVYPHTGLYQTYFDGFQRLWDNCDPKIRDAYGEEWREKTAKVVASAPGLLGNKDRDEVPNAVVHALTSSHPLHRYRCGIDSKFIVPYIAKLPESVQSAFNTVEFWRKDYGKYDTKARYLLAAAASVFALSKL